jgi:hypothetical protein
MFSPNPVCKRLFFHQTVPYRENQVDISFYFFLIFGIGRAGIHRAVQGSGLTTGTFLLEAPQRILNTTGELKMPA